MEQYKNHVLISMSLYIIRWVQALLKSSNVWKNSAFYAVGTALGKASILAINFYLLHKLKLESYGAFSFVYSLSSSISILLGGSAYVLTNRYVSAGFYDRNTYKDIKTQKSAVVSIIIGIGSAIVVLFGILLCSNEISQITFGHLRYVNAIEISALMIYSVVTSNIFSSILISQEAFIENSVIGFAIGIAQILMTPIFVLKLGWEGAFYAIFVGNIGGAICSIAVQWRKSKPHIMRFDREYLRNSVEQIHFFAPYLLSGLIGVPVNIVLMYILNKSENPEVQAGYYNFATQLRIMILFVPNILAQALLQGLIALRNVPTQYVKTVREVLIVSIFTSIFATSVVWLVFDKVFVATKSDLIQSKTTVLLFAVAGIISTIPGVFGQVALERGKLSQGIFCNSIWSIIVVVTFTILYRQGSKGLALSMIVSYAILAVISYFFFRHNVKLILSRRT
jgi:O-antigen/teichoic acid export membrane protein